MRQKETKTERERVISSLSSEIKNQKPSTTHSHVLPPREEPQRRPGANRQRDAAQKKNVAHREQPAVEEERDAKEGEEHAEGGKPDADFCFSLIFFVVRLRAREEEEERERGNGERGGA